MERNLINQLMLHEQIMPSSYLIKPQEHGDRVETVINLAFKKKIVPHKKKNVLSIMVSYRENTTTLKGNTRYRETGAFLPLWFTYILRQGFSVGSLSGRGVASLKVRSSSKIGEKGECRLVNDRFSRRQGASTLWVSLLRSDTVATFSATLVINSNCDHLCWICFAYWTIWLCRCWASAVVWATNAQSSAYSLMVC